jgi:hypothetical protein
MKYKTLEELVLAFESGELSKDYCCLTLDNDDTFAADYSDDSGAMVFNGGTPNQLLREALTLLGVPWEEV